MSAHLVRIGVKIAVTALVGMVAYWANPTASAQINGPSPTDITVDGQFTGSSLDSNNAFVMGAEWSGVTPAAFISSPAGAFPTGVSNPLANALTYGVVAQGAVVPQPAQLYLMYDYLPRTNPIFAPGEFIADITFPLHLSTQQDPDATQTITVQFRGATIIAAGFQPASPFDVFVDIDFDGDSDFLASQLGIQGAIAFGPSTLSITDHLLIELGVPLFISADFADPNDSNTQDQGEFFPPGGTSGSGGNGYSPAPQFWSASAAKNDVDPPISSAIFQLTPTGNTVVIPQPLPEPSTSVLLASGLVLLMRRRRR